MLQTSTFAYLEALWLADVETRGFWSVISVRHTIELTMSVCHHRRCICGQTEVLEMPIIHFIRRLRIVREMSI